MKKFLMVKMIVLFAAILCFGISPTWGAKLGAKLYVDASASAGGDGMSWETAFTDLQDALDAAVFGDEIWVAAGTYKPTNTSDRSISFALKSGVKIYGGFAGDEDQLKERRLDPSLTVLSGDIGTIDDDTDNSFHVVYADGVTDAVLDGFTVTLGRGEGKLYSDRNGAGMYNYESSLTVANCIFKDNQVAVKTHVVSGYGGGMYNYNSAPIVTNCTFIGNRAGEGAVSSKGYGGAMYNYGSFGSDLGPRWPVITGCTFRDNKRGGSSVEQKDGGGGMYNDYCIPTIDRCTFADNYSRAHGGAMFNYGAEPIITNCIFTGNYTYPEHNGGAMYNYGSRPTILNCTFYQNGWGWHSFPPYFRPFTLHGGAIHLNNSPATIANTVFMENAARGEGGALSHYSTTPYSWPTLYNCLFYENIRWNLWGDKVKYPSHVLGNLNRDSVNNLYDIDPLLVDPAGGDFRLRYDSPGIDAGYALTFGYLPSPYPFGLPATDFEGDKRIVDGDGDGETAIDIGVDEFTPNLPDLALFLQALADAGEIDSAVADRLLVYVDAAQAALDREEEQTAINLLNELIADAWASLDDTEIAQVIEMKTQAVIEEI